MGQVCAEHTDKESLNVSKSPTDRGVRRDRAHVPFAHLLLFPQSVAMLRIPAARTPAVTTIRPRSVPWVPPHETSPQRLRET